MRLAILDSAIAPVAGAVRLGRRGVEGLTLTAVDAALGARVTAEIVDRIAASTLVQRAAGQVLAGPLVEAITRDLVRHAVLERMTETVLDGDGLEAALDSPAMERLVARVIDSRLLDEAVVRLLESEELWLVVDEIARSPAVTDAITQQSMGFADQVAGGVRARSRSADAWLERAARRALRRRPVAETAPPPAEPGPP